MRWFRDKTAQKVEEKKESAGGGGLSPHQGMNGKYNPLVATVDTEETRLDENRTQDPQYHAGLPATLQFATLLVFCRAQLRHAGKIWRRVKRSFN